MNLFVTWKQRRWRLLVASVTATSNSSTRTFVQGHPETCHRPFEGFYFLICSLTGNQRHGPFDEVVVCFEKEKVRTEKKKVSATKKRKEKKKEIYSALPSLIARDDSFWYAVCLWFWPMMVPMNTSTSVKEVFHGASEYWYIRSWRLSS